MLDILKNLFKDKKKKKYKANYPKTVAEILDDNVDYKDGIHEIVKRFKSSKPYKGNKEELQNKFRAFCSELATLHGIEIPQIAFVKEFYPSSCYFPVGNLIVLTEEFDNRYSVVVFLHEFGHALKMDERDTCRWSINLFRKHFPKSYSRLVPQGHLLFSKKSTKALE